MMTVLVCLSLHACFLYNVCRFCAFAVQRIYTRYTVSHKTGGTFENRLTFGKIITQNKLPPLMGQSVYATLVDNQRTLYIRDVIHACCSC